MVTVFKVLRYLQGFLSIETTKSDSNGVSVVLTTKPLSWLVGAD